MSPVVKIKRGVIGDSSYRWVRVFARPLVDASGRDLPSWNTTAYPADATIFEEADAAAFILGREDHEREQGYSLWSVPCDAGGWVSCMDQDR